MANTDLYFDLFIIFGGRGIR